MDSDEQIKLALEHSRELFIYHAGQRIQSLNFYFLAIAIFLTGFGHVATSDLREELRALFGVVLAFAGYYITMRFQELDKRNEELVHCDERLLKAVEKKMASTEEGVTKWEVTKAADRASGASRYSTVVPKIFRLYLGLSIAGGLYSVWPWFDRLCRL